MSETATKKKEPGMATLVIVLFAICAATALLLGLTNYVTAPFIAANNEKTTQEAMAAVLPANSYDEVEYTGGDAMAVSYTHLDVYKRHPLPWCWASIIRCQMK